MPVWSIIATSSWANPLVLDLLVARAQKIELLLGVGRLHAPSPSHTPPPNTATCEAGIMPWFGPCSQFRGRPSYRRRTPLLPRLAPIIRCTVVGEVSWGA